MNSREVRWITAAVAAGLLAAVAIGQTGQQKPAAPATGSKAPQTKERAADQAGDRTQDRAAERRRPRDIEESAPGKSVRMRGQTGQVSDADRDAWRRVLVAEAKYRKRLAQVRRYRELAEQAGDKKRIVKANYLENKINQAHAKHMELARKQLGDEKFNLIKVRMQQGRERRGDQGKGGPARKGQAQGAKQEQERTGTGQQDPQKRSRNRGAKDTDEQKSEDS